MASSQAGHITAAAATAVVAALGLNSYFGLSRDLAHYQSQKAYGKLMAAHITRTGPQSTSLYRLLETADPNADAIYFEGRSWTFAAVRREVHAISLGLQTLGVQNDDIVGVFMSNSPEMVFVIYALSKLGAVPALMNSNLRDDTLLHCVRIGGSNLVISTPDIAVHAASAASKVTNSPTPIKVVSLNLGSFPSSSDPSINPFPYPTGTLPPDTLPAPQKTMASRAAFIFTSGTTGKPKACSLKAGMIMVTSCPTPADCPDGVYPTPGSAAHRRNKYLPARIFSCMPLFHGTTFFTGLCYGVGTSSCFCIGRKFSARNYFREVCESRATRVLYVGELCRFLLATPPSEWDEKHNVKVAAGNGLQKDVWTGFQRRFGIDEVREFYRSTEGLVKYDNVHFRSQGQRGAGRVGYRGRLLWRRERVEQCIVKFDFDAEVPVRDADGWCVVAERDEPGEAIAKIVDRATYTDYHNNEKATEGKLLRDVFEKGDCWQRSGDLLVVQNDGWVRFVDRIGDTFRWKGENVSAGEIREYIAEAEEAQDVVVVGKALKGYDGQVGVAAVSLTCCTLAEEKAFMDGLYGRLKARGVPHYAFPRLVAITDEVTVGDTFKHAKQVVKGITWSEAGDGKKYILDLAKDRYIPLTKDGWAAIEVGRAKL